MQTVVRLLCLASITSGGIKAKILERIKRDFLQVRVRPSRLSFDSNTLFRHTGITSYPSFYHSQPLPFAYFSLTLFMLRQHTKSPPRSTPLPPYASRCDF